MSKFIFNRGESARNKSWRETFTTLCVRFPRKDDYKLQRKCIPGTSSISYLHGNQNVIYNFIIIILETDSNDKLLQLKVLYSCLNV